MYIHTETVELSFAFFTVAEETDSDAFPVTAAHREAVACRDEVLSVRAIRELMAVLLTVVSDPKVDRGWDFRIGSNVKVDNLPLTIGLDEDTLRTDADATEQLSRAEETCIAVARSGE